MIWAVCAVLLFLVSSCVNRNQQGQNVKPETDTPDRSGEEQDIVQDSTSNVQQDFSYSSFLRIASNFKDVPYHAGRLEHHDGVERLVVDTSALDCMTFLESSMALFRLNRLPESQRDNNNYRNLLIKIRYRDGVLTDYTSRLHYGSEWIADNIKKGFLQDITDSIAALGGDLLNVKGVSRPLPIRVHLMTSQPQRYETLQKHPEFTVAMYGIEQRVNQLHLTYIPRDRFVATNPFLPDGCIVAFSTSIDGLDIAHFGIVCYMDGQPHLLHASSSAKKVTVTKEPLYDYLSGIGHYTGVILLKAI